ncbi:hypothetical protein RJ639_046600 [Escallonia herrerae]|uniref:Protein DETOXIFICATION n=1 Tax=Escallonia herrerae TaxID=1293975 RepID=A0AA88W7W1_9ASTE|nr:hypothetical protein RJ639_046600 [Escallonia herrerae]
MSFSSLFVRQRKRFSSTVRNQLSSDCGVHTSDVDESSAVEEAHAERVNGLLGIVSPDTSDNIKKEFTVNSSSHSEIQDVKRELIWLSLPALAGQAIDPMAQLMETAFIGRLGAMELASAGVSMSIFNIISKLFNVPLLGVATSFVAEDISNSASRVSTVEEGQQGSANGKPFDGVDKRQQLSSVSTALLLAIGIGIFEALALWLGSGLFLNLMSVSSASPMRAPAQRFLSLRALGAPAVVVSLALQGVFRGFKDTKTPVLCLGKCLGFSLISLVGIGNLSAAFLLPILIYYFRLGVTGAAISTVVSQYIVTFLMIWYLSQRAILLPPSLEALQFGGYVKSDIQTLLRYALKQMDGNRIISGFLVGRTMASLLTMTLGTSMAARQGPLAMAAHQICLQVWLAVSLLTDALAASCQALVASSISKRDYKAAREITHFVLKTGLVAGFSLAVVLGLSFTSLSTFFTKDREVLGILRTGVLFVSASQPLTALAFIYDGLHYGVSDFPYAACSMMLVGAISSAFLLYAPSVFGLPGVWTGLALFMGLRAMAGYIR